MSTGLTSQRNTAGSILLLLVVLLLALHVRMLGIGAGLPYLHHWDEPYSAASALRMLKTGDFNPHFYDYPAVLIYSCLGVDSLHYFSLMKKAPGDPDYVEGLDAIQPNGANGWLWEVSHPSFYRADRAMVALHGTLAVLLVFLLGQALFGTRAGLLAALMLAGFGFPVEHSRYITPNVPVMTFILLTVLFSVYYLRSARVGQLIWAAVFAGLACGTKYNAVVVFIVPLAALVLGPTPSRGGRLPLSFLVGALPFVIFLLVNPYTVIDLPTFLTQAGLDIRHYSVVQGTGAVEEVFTRVHALVAPGWDHLWLQLTRFRANVGLPVLLAAILGMLAGRAREKRAVLVSLLFPIVYLAFMTQQKVGFHRNLTVLYAFIALYAGAGLLAFSTFLMRRREQHTFSLALVLCLLFVGPGHVRTWREAHRLEKAVEPRSQVIDELNEQSGMDGRAAIGVARELHMHPLDLGHIHGRYQVEPHEQLMAHLGRYDYLLVGRYESHNPALHKEDARLNGLTPSDRIVATVGWGNGTHRDIYSVNPSVSILRGKQGDLLAPDELSTGSLVGSFEEEPPGTLFVQDGRPMRSPRLHLAPGRYRIGLDLIGAATGNEPPRLDLLLGERRLGSVDATSAYQHGIVDFALTEPEEARLILQMGNPVQPPPGTLEVSRAAKLVEKLTSKVVDADAACGVYLPLLPLRAGESVAPFTQFVNMLEAAGFSVVGEDEHYRVVPLPDTDVSPSPPEERVLWFRNLSLVPTGEGS